MMDDTVPADPVVNEKTEAAKLKEEAKRQTNAALNRLSGNENLKRQAHVSLTDRIGLLKIQEPNLKLNAR